MERIRHQFNPRCVMSKDLGIFTPATTGRYTARPPAKPWDVMEDIAILPPILGCQSQRAYYATCEALCRVLGRMPAYGPNERPTRDTVTKDCVSIIERRLVTQTLTAPNGDMIERLTDLNNAHNRNAMPWTWAEASEVAVPYFRKDETNRINTTAVEEVLGRPGMYGNIKHQAEVFARYPHDGDPTIVPPCRDAFPEWSGVVAKLAAVEHDNRRAAVYYWGELHELNDL